METYRRSLKQSYQMRDIVNCAKMESKMEGRLEGILEGEMKANRQFAIRLLQKNIPIDEIALLTDLDRTQIQDLLQEN